MTRALRVPILVLLPVLLVLGLVVETSRDEPVATDVRVGELTPTAAAAGTLGSTWYCAAGSATGVASGEGAGPAEQTVVVANASDTAATGTVTLYPDGGAPTVVPVEVAAHGRAEVVVSQHVVAPWAAALVEVTGGEVTVAHSLVGPTGRSVSDCASAPSASWYFSGGTTRVGSEMWLALFNPFPGEATVDVAFDTDSGIRTPPSFQGIVVPGGSVVVRRVGQPAVVEGEAVEGEAADGEAAETERATVSLMEQVSTTVSVRSGRIVAEQIQSFVGRDGGVKGLSATIGATTPASVWSFPMSAPEGTDVVETVAVFNPGDTDTEVQVQVQLDEPALNGTVEPFEVSVPAHRYAVVTVTDLEVGVEDRVPPGVPHWVIVRSVDGADIVAQRSISSTAVGFSTTIGLPVVATRWLAPMAVPTDTATSQLAIANPSPTDPATVSVRRQGSGAATDVADLVDLEVPPGERIVVNLGPSGFTGTDSVEVISDIPVVVGQWLAFSTPADIATPLGVPVSGTQSVPEDVIGPGVAGELSTDDIVPSETLVDPDTAPSVDDTTGSTPPVDATADASSTTTTTAPAAGG